MSRYLYLFTIILPWILLISISSQRVSGQNYNNNYNTNLKDCLKTSATWCTVSKEEEKKCLNFSTAVKNHKEYFGCDLITINCRNEQSKEDCMRQLNDNDDHITSLDPGEVFIGGKDYSLVPIIKEIYDKHVSHNYAVAVIKKNTLTDVQSLHNLRGKKACFAGVNKLAGWTIPIHTLMLEGGLEIMDCNNHVKSAINYFGPSCAVGSLTRRQNPLGDNSNQLCELCIGKVPGGRCTDADPYADYKGAFRCLVEAGEIAFLIHTTVDEATSSYEFNNSVKKEDYELLCKDGTRRSVDDYANCHWGRAPSRAIVTSTAVRDKRRELYQKFFNRAAILFGNNLTVNYNQQQNYSTEGDDNWGSNYGNDNYDLSRVNFDRSNSNPPGVKSLDDPGFRLFESAPTYGMQGNLMFSDASRGFVDIKRDGQNFLEYLGPAHEAVIGIRRCPIARMTLCVTSSEEANKCAEMKTALEAQLLKPELMCFKATSQIHCMQEIKSGKADVAVLDAGDIYTAGQYYNLIPFMSEKYDLPTPEYYVVAVAKDLDPSTQLTFLKNKNTCHTGINTAAGWIYPMAYLLANDWIRGYGCDSIHAAAEYFTKSCIPGASSIEYNYGVPYDNMCDLCHGTSYHLCRRDSSEDYFGYSGAFRCLVEGGGDVAFVKHTTVFENTNGKRIETWGRNEIMDQYELLCPDGTRRKSTEYLNCNLGKVKANAIVTRGGYDSYWDTVTYNKTEINTFINLFLYTQQFYGRKRVNDYTFSMFTSKGTFSDLIFQDATEQLVVIPPEEREYSRYLGEDFMRAERIVNCNAGAAAINYSIFLIFILIIFSKIFVNR